MSRVQLHFERWACVGTSASKTPMEVMEANGTMTVKITPAVEKDGSLSLLTQIEAVEANGMSGRNAAFRSSGRHGA